MSRLGDTFNTYFEMLLIAYPKLYSDAVVSKLLGELRESGTPLDEDAVVYTMARSIAWGLVAQLTNDADDPGWVNRAVGATEGFYTRDYCGAAARKGRGVALAVRTFTPEEFLARDTTGTLAARAQAFENALLS